MLTWTLDGTPSQISRLIRAKAKPGSHQAITEQFIRYRGQYKICILSDYSPRPTFLSFPPDPITRLQKPKGHPDAQRSTPYPKTVLLP